MFLCKNMCFHLLCVTMINNCPRNLIISDFCNWEKECRMLLHTHRSRGTSNSILVVLLPLLGGPNAARKRPRILFKDCSNAARMFLQFCSNEWCSNAVWSRNRKWTKLSKPRYKQARTCRRYEKDQFLVQDQGTLRVRVFLSFVLPPPLPSSTHSINTRLQQNGLVLESFWLAVSLLNRLRFL
jgi:hypothetical protein